MTEWDAFDEEVEECLDCGSLSHPELCPKHQDIFDNWYKILDNKTVEGLQ